MSLSNYSALLLKKTTNFASAALPLIYLAQYIIKNMVQFCITTELFFHGEYVTMVLVWYFFVAFNYFPPTSTQMNNFFIQSHKINFAVLGGFGEVGGFIFVDRHGAPNSMDYFLA